MTKKIKILTGLTVVLAIVVTALVIWDKNRQQKKALSGEPFQSQQTKDPEFSPISQNESLDEIVAGIAADANTDQAVAAQSDTSASYVGQTNNSINITNLYNASVF